MSSHREAPEISKDPVADSTDVYAFVSPDRPDTVTLIANYIPLQKPDGGPNFYEFGDDVLYEIHISNAARPRRTSPTSSSSHTKIRNKTTFLYNTGPITSIDDADLEPAAVLLGDPDRGRQHRRSSARDLACPPVNVGPRSTPNYAGARAPRRCTRSPAAARSSPASGPTPSTSTSAASSTSGRCGRSTPRT